MLRTKLAKKVLSKKEQKHLTEDAGIHSMSQMKRQAEFMKAEKNPCIECRIIARKLGLWEEI